MTPGDGKQSKALREGVWIVVATVAFAIFSARVELSESILAWTRPLERLQLDELPGVLLFLALAMSWFAWRRTGEARAALTLRLGTEAKLRVALARNRELAHANVRIQEEERRILARELHDELGQCLNAVKIDAVCLRDGEAGHIPEVKAAANAIKDVTDHLEIVVRDMVQRLRPPGLDELGLPAAIENCVEGWRRRLPQIDFEFAIGEDIGTFDEATNITLYRLVQEGLTNIAKHAHASRVEIEVQQSLPGSPGHASVVLTVRDNGIGVRKDGRGAGLGIAGMRERVEALAGRLDLIPVREGGFGFTARLPIRTVAT